MIIIESTPEGYLSVTAGRYVAYASLWLLVVAVHHRSVFRAPQWILLLAIAACVSIGG
jgi:hypothetical protein